MANKKYFKRLSTELPQTTSHCFTPSPSRTPIKLLLKGRVQYVYLITRISGIVLYAQGVFVRTSVYCQRCQRNQKREVRQKVHSKCQPTKLLPVRKQVVLKIPTIILQVFENSSKPAKHDQSKIIRR